MNDRYGFIPHYYTLQEEEFIFSPEIKAILQSNVDKKLNIEALGEYLSFGMFFDNKTIFEKIYILPPATILIYDNNAIHLGKYWEFKYSCDYSISEDAYIKELIETFRSAVNIRLKEELRYCIGLSGGLDSRCIVGAINNENKRKVFAFCFGANLCDEINIARKIASKCNIKFVTANISPQSIISNADKEVYLTDGRTNIGMSYDFSIGLVYLINRK